MIAYRVTSIVVGLIGFGVGSMRPHATALPIESAAPRSERWQELAPILLPESGVSAFSARDGASAVFRFVVDTLGRIELGTVETLVADDSASAQEMRRGLSGVRYIPARLIENVGRCVRFNGSNAHCGGATPAIKRVRARVVLTIDAYTEPTS